MICMNAQSKRYCCSFCGKTTVKREVIGIWSCRFCGKKVSGGAYVPITNQQVEYKQVINRMKME
uniref:60S ribosomal protein L37a n=1 Tax=Spraguea lophii (strain 42_110) TaxID=1358809 RepID=S7W6N9_SPRLO